MAPSQTEIEKKIGEITQLLKGLEPLLDMKDGLTTLKERVDAIASQCEEYKGLDIKLIQEEFDALKASQEAIANQIRKSRSGLYVPGFEDIGKEFSLLRASVAHKTGDWSNAGFEKEVIDQATKKAREVYQKASLTVGDALFGGDWVPDQVIADVIGDLYSQSIWFALDGNGRTRVSVLQGLVGGEVKIPKFESGVVAYWVGEEDEYTESAAKTKDVTMRPHKLGVLTRMTWEHSSFVGYGFEQLFRNDVARKMAAKIDWTIPYGTGGDNMPLGIVKRPGVLAYSAQSKGEFVIGDDAGIAAGNGGDWDGGVLDYEGLDNMKLLLRERKVVPDSSFSFMSSPRFFHKLRNWRSAAFSAQESGATRPYAPYMLGMPMLSDERLRSIIGDYGESEQIPFDNLPGASIGAPTDSVTTKYTDVFAGNLSNIVFGRWQGLMFDDDMGKGLGFKTDHRYMKFRMLCDVSARREQEIIVCPDASTDIVYA